MAGNVELNILKQHIQDLSAEISSLKKQISPYISAKDYKTIHKKFLSLSNLRALAKNELEALMYHYKIVLSGKTRSEEVPVEKVIRRKFKCEIDCRLHISRNLDISIHAHHEMYSYIFNNYAAFFQEGKFKIRSIIQLK